MWLRRLGAFFLKFLSFLFLLLKTCTGTVISFLSLCLLNIQSKKANVLYPRCRSQKSIKRNICSGALSGSLFLLKSHSQISTCPLSLSAQNMLMSQHVSGRFCLFASLKSRLETRIFCVLGAGLKYPTIGAMFGSSFWLLFSCSKCTHYQYMSAFSICSKQYSLAACSGALFSQNVYARIHNLGRSVLSKYLIIFLLFEMNFDWRMFVASGCSKEYDHATWFWGAYISQIFTLSHLTWGALFS